MDENEESPIITEEITIEEPVAKTESPKSRAPKAFSTVGLVLGIVGVCLSFIPAVNIISIICGITGLVFAIISLCKKTNKGKSIAGVILCGIAILVSIIMYLAIYSSAQKAVIDWADDLESNYSSNFDDDYTWNFDYDWEY